jgi:outer membrane protein TolC
MHSRKLVDSRQYEAGRKNPLFTICCMLLTAYCLLFAVSCLLFANSAFADELKLQPLIDEALKNNPEILVSESRATAAGFRIPQAESLSDPMFMIGYKNDGTRDLYSFNKEMAADSEWMFSVSQMFPYPGKLTLKSRMASSDAESLKAMTGSVRLKIISRVKELYYDLLFTYKNIDLINNMTDLFSKIEDAAVSRYSAGMAPQQEVLMAQTEKYMLLEKEEMLKQNIQSLEAMLNSTVGRDVNAPLGKPSEISPSVFSSNMDELIHTTYENSPEIKAKDKMIAGGEAKVQMAEKEYYPDFTVSANYFAKNKYYDDMWSLTTAINVPIFYKSKQRQAVLEAEASLSEVRNELAATKLMISSAIRDNYSMLKTSEKLMELYKNGLIPKTYQDFDSALAGYGTGRVEAITVITRLKSVIDYETLYWKQFVEREKAIARLEALTTVGAR